MDAQISINTLMQMGGIILGAWGFYKVIMEIIRSINERHDREQTWDDAVKNIAKEREQITLEFSSRLDEQDAKFQQLLAMLSICLRAQDTMLEALTSANIGNGDVKEMRKELKKFISEQITVQ